MEYSVAFVEQVKNPTPEELEKAAFSAENVLASIHPITYSCFTSAFEIGEAADYYVDSFKDLKMISYNIVHSLGNIYDTIFFLIRHQQMYSPMIAEGVSDKEINNWWFKLGIYYGTIIYQVFYTDHEREVFDAANNYDDYQGLDNAED